MVKRVVSLLTGRKTVDTLIDNDQLTSCQVGGRKESALVCIESEREERIMADHKEFARRLKQASDSNPLIPEFGRGQQVYFANHLDVSQEAVRRWFEGESRPRPKLMTKLAKLLNVDEAWLALGVNPVMGGKEKKQYSDRAEAGAYAALAVFMSNGHSCAFSGEDNDAVDFYAIRSGQQKSISVTTAREKSKGVWEIPVRPTFRNTVNVAVMPQGKTKFQMLLMDLEGLEEHGERRGGYVQVTANRNGRFYQTGRHQWKALEDSGVL